MFYSEELHDRVTDKLQEDEKSGKSFNKQYKRDKKDEIRMCLAHKYLMESAGFVVHEVFVLEKFNAYLKNIRKYQ